MERLYVYGLCRQVMVPQLKPGCYNLPVSCTCWEGIGAVVSNWNREESPNPTAENLMAHNDILEATAEYTAVLPVRFGTLTTQEALNDFLQKNKEKILERLALVKDRIEMGLKIIKPGSSPGEAGVPLNPPRTGKAYMEALFTRYQKKALTSGEEEEILREIRGKLQEISITWEKSKLRGTLLFNGAFLMEKGQTVKFYGTVEEIKKKYRDLIILASGPWPPYSFAGWEEGYE